MYRKRLKNKHSSKRLSRDPRMATCRVDARGAGAHTLWFVYYVAIVIIFCVFERPFAHLDLRLRTCTVFFAALRFIYNFAIQRIACRQNHIGYVCSRPHRCSPTSEMHWTVAKKNGYIWVQKYKQKWNKMADIYKFFLIKRLKYR